MNKKILLIIAVFASAALSAHADLVLDPTNLVGNPGFETGTFSSWTQFGNTGFTGVGTSSPDGTLPHSGTYLAFFGPVGTDGGINQTLTAPAGIYHVDFWLAAGGGTATDHFSASLGGTTFYSTVGIGAFSYIHVMGTVTTGANPVLQFTTENAPSWWDLDDINVVAVPEPGTLGLIGLGALGLVGALRKRLFV
jgi:hypothetical protein